MIYSDLFLFTIDSFFLLERRILINISLITDDVDYKNAKTTNKKSRSQEPAIITSGVN